MRRQMTPAQLATLKLLQEDDDDDEEEDGGMVVRSTDDDDQFIYQSNFDASNYIERFSRDTTTGISTKIAGEQSLGNIAEEEKSQQVSNEQNSSATNKGLYSEIFNDAHKTVSEQLSDRKQVEGLGDEISTDNGDTATLGILESCPSPIEKTRNSTTKSELPRAALNPLNNPSSSSPSSLPKSSNTWREVDPVNSSGSLNQNGDDDEEGVWGNDISLTTSSGHAYSHNEAIDDATHASISRYEPPKPEVFYQHFTPTLTPTLSPQTSADNPNDPPNDSPNDLPHDSSHQNPHDIANVYGDSSIEGSPVNTSNPTPEQLLWNQSLSRNPVIVGNEYVLGGTSQQNPPQHPPQPQKSYDPKLDAATRHLNEILANKAMMYEQLARDKAGESSSNNTTPPMTSLSSSIPAGSRKISHNVFEPQKPPHSLTENAPKQPIIPSKLGQHPNSPQSDSSTNIASYHIENEQTVSADNPLYIVESTDTNVITSYAVGPSNVGNDNLRSTTSKDVQDGDISSLLSGVPSKVDLSKVPSSKIQYGGSSSRMFENIKQVSDSDTPSKLTIDSISRANKNAGGERAKSETTPIVVSSGVLNNARHTGAPAISGIDLHRNVSDSSFGLQGIECKSSIVVNTPGGLGTIDSYTTPSSSCSSPLLTTQSPTQTNASLSYRVPRTHESLSTGDLSTSTSSSPGFSGSHNSTYTSHYGRGDTANSMTHPLENSMSHSLGNSMNHSLNNAMTQSVHSLGLRSMTRTASLQVNIIKYITVYIYY